MNKTETATETTQALAVLGLCRAVQPLLDDVLKGLPYHDCITQQLQLLSGDMERLGHAGNLGGPTGPAASETRYF